MRRKISNQNIILLELGELLLDPIFRETLCAPRLLGEHTFSTNSLNNLPKFINNRGTYIYHPFTRAKHYIEAIKKLHKNHMIDSILLIYLYCRKINIDESQMRNLICYLIEQLLIEQKKLVLLNKQDFIKSEYFFTFNNLLRDITFKKIIDFLEINKEIQKILSATEVNQLINNYFIPNDEHLNHILYLAIKFNNLQLANLLLKVNFEIDINLSDQKGKTSFFWACYHKNYIVAKRLMNLGAELFKPKVHSDFIIYSKNLKRVIRFLINIKNGVLINNYVKRDFRYNSSNVLFNYDHKKKLVNKEFSSNNDLDEWHVVTYKKNRTVRFDLA